MLRKIFVSVLKRKENREKLEKWSQSWRKMEKFFDRVLGGIGSKYRETEGSASNEINTGLIASIAVLIRLTKIRQLNCHRVRSHGVNTPRNQPALQYRIAINGRPFPFLSKKIQVDRLDGSLIPLEKNESSFLFYLDKPANYSSRAWKSTRCGFITCGFKIRDFYSSIRVCRKLFNS